MIESSIYSVLAANAGITAIVGSRIYPLVLPTDPELPALTYSIVANVSKPTFSTSGGQKARVQIDCWGTRYSDSASLRSAVMAALNGYTGPEFTSILLNTSDVFEHESLKFRCYAEFYVFYTL